MKNYLIIGGSSGIGYELTGRLSENGNRVWATFNKTTDFQRISGVEYHHLNVLEDSIELAFVPNELHGLVYCPGSINLKPFLRIKKEDFLQDFQLQTLGAIQVIQKSLPALKAADDSSIVLFSTVAVQTGFNFHSQVSASKGAIEGLTKSLAAEFAPKVRVNCIAPSLTKTPLAGRLLNSEDKIEANANRHPLKKIGHPKDIASMAKFLLSDEASWMTGQIIHVDGGMGVIRN